jgi:hypothetical protein
MTTFLWIVMIYSITVLISEAIVVWAMNAMKSQNRIKNIVDNPLINWRYAVFILAIIPVINLLIALTMIRTVLVYRKAKKKTKIIADKLRAIGQKYPDLDGKMDQIANVLENLPDQE